jgi:SAM-dependent methyltransferase
MWKRWNLGKAYRGDISALNALYCVRDPWRINSPEERLRFQETARVIREKIGVKIQGILEIGCGEGLQTETLALLATRVVGLDPSARAVARARARHIRNASFDVGDLTTWQKQSEESFELVTACECLYYMQDLETAYRALYKLGENCLVTYYEGAFARLDAFFAEKAVKSETIQGNDCKWRLVYWGKRMSVG